MRRGSYIYFEVLPERYAYGKEEVPHHAIGLAPAQTLRFACSRNAARHSGGMKRWDKLPQADSFHTEQHSIQLARER
jgi:hypothetical protein